MLGNLNIKNISLVVKISKTWDTKKKTSHVLELEAANSKFKYYSRRQISFFVENNLL